MPSPTHFPLLYQIIEADSSRELDEKVSDRMMENEPSEFWEPIGAPQICDGGFYQSMVHYITPDVWEAI